jgi:hypothetical protein
VGVFVDVGPGPVGVRLGGTDRVAVCEGNGVRVRVKVRVGEAVRDGVTVREAVGLEVGRNVGLGVRVTNPDGNGVAVSDGVWLGENDAVSVDVGVLDASSPWVAVDVTVAVIVGVCVSVATAAVSVVEAVGVTLETGLLEGEGVAWVETLNGVFVGIVASVGVGVGKAATMLTAADTSAAFNTPSALASAPAHWEPTNTASKVATMSTVSRLPLQFASPGTA